MSIDLKVEKAKQEYVNTINEINKKYDLPFTIVEMLLSGILNEVHNIKITQIEKEREELAKKDGDK
mgnify:FL=1